MGHGWWKQIMMPDALSPEEITHARKERMAGWGIVLIVIDSLRADALHCYGSEDTVAHNIENLAADGVLFEQAIAQGHATLTAVPTIMSGTYPSMYGGFERLAAKRPSLARTLSALGFQTAAFLPNPYLSEARGYGIGFDHFDECVPRTSRDSKSVTGLLRRALNRLGGRWGVGIECPPYLNAARVTERAVDWLRGTSGPFFLWLQYMDVHMPYNLERCALLLPRGTGQRPYEYGFWRRCVQDASQVTKHELMIAQHLYRDGLAFVDRQIGMLKDVLQDLGRLEETKFLITSDHGEGFGERGWFGHQNYLYEESIHVPLILTPRDAGLPKRISTQVRHLDLAPTLIDFVGGAPPPEMQGVSLIPLLAGAAPDEVLPAISQTSPRNEWRIALRQPPWKLIWQLNPETMVTINVELYHLGNDPDEQTDMANHYPDQVTSMQERLWEHILHLDLEGYREQMVSESDPSVMERLRALGYLGDS
jgi:arylsulfatase A-like enzyme